MNRNENHRAGLRTKTGCLTCRARRKKCDEQRPTCHKCITSKRPCQWPSSDNLIDRRHSSKRSEKAWSPPSVSRAKPVLNNGKAGASFIGNTALSNQSQISVESEVAATQIIRRDLEPLLAGHFASTYYQTILLPDCHNDFYHGWISDIQKFMKQHKSVYYSVLACSASQIYSLSNVSQMRQLAIEYYSQSIKEVSKSLELSSVAHDDGLLTCIILLYLHGCLGLATFEDVPPHLSAAIKLLRLRFLNKPPETVICRPFDRIALESVLYQVFITTMGSWCLPPSGFHFDAEFWFEVEALLSRSTLFPDRSMSFNSPVLGTPLPLFRLILSVKQLSQTSYGQDEENMDRLKEELSQWEPLIWTQECSAALHFDSTMPHYHIYKDVSLLYILIASLLLDQVIENRDAEPEVSLKPRPSTSWQVYEIRQVLCRHATDEEWSKCFIGCWPVYTVGFFMIKPADQDMIRSDLHRRRIMTGSSQMFRFLEELEMTWTCPELSMSSRVTCLD